MVTMPFQSAETQCTLLAIRYSGHDKQPSGHVTCLFLLYVQWAQLCV